MLTNLGLTREYTSRYRARIVQGLATYGEFDPATDARCLSGEAIEELLDVGSYLEFLEEKHPEMGSGVQKCRAKAILLYGELRKLERLELKRVYPTQGKERTT
jgi:hypothetical protein